MFGLSWLRLLSVRVRPMGDREPRLHAVATASSAICFGPVAGLWSVAVPGHCGSETTIPSGIHARRFWDELRLL
jgi:hypothetical protein